MNITKKLCKNFSEREGYKPELIVIHISAGSLTSMTSWFQTPNSQASAHYGVGKDGSVLQYVEEDKKAWHAGRVNNPTFKLYKQGVNPNLYTIGIENEGMDLKNHTELQMKSLCELIKDIGARNSYGKIGDIKPFEKVLNAYPQFISLFKSAKVAMNPASHVVANIGNFFMGAMMGLPVYKKEYLEAIRRASSMTKGKLGVKEFKQLFFSELNNMEEMMKNHPNRFRSMTGIDPSEIYAKKETA